MGKKLILYFVDGYNSLANLTMYGLASELGDIVGPTHCYYDKGWHTISTEHVVIHVVHRGNCMEALRYDEIFNTNDPIILARLNNPNKPRFKGSILDYVEQVEKEMSQHTGDEK